MIAAVATCLVRPALLTQCWSAAAAHVQAATGGYAYTPALAAQAATMNAAMNMRVSVDKGRQTDYDQQFEAEDTTAKDHADEVMKRCEDVTKMLRKTLGKHTDGDRWGARGREAGVGACFGVSDTIHHCKESQADGARAGLQVHGGILRNNLFAFSSEARSCDWLTKCLPC